MVVQDNNEMSTNLICEVCQTLCSNASNLKRHKRTTKYCLEQRTDNQPLDVKPFTCDYCKYSTHFKQHLNQHLETCKFKSEAEKKQKENQHIENLLLKKELDLARVQRDEYKKKTENSVQIEDIQMVGDDANISVIRKNDALSLNGVFIVVRASDGFINLTQLCKAGGERLEHWTRLDQTREYLKALSESTHVRVDRILTYEDHGPKNRATWGHPLSAIYLAQWLNPEFAVKVSKWVWELGMTGSVTLGHEKSLAELENVWKAQCADLKRQIQSQDSVLLEKDEKINDLDKQINSLTTVRADKKKMLDIVGQFQAIKYRTMI